jgi:hypothetical protein
MSDKLESPAYSTSVGLLRWAQLMSDLIIEPEQRGRRPRKPQDGMKWDPIKEFLKKLLP